MKNFKIYLRLRRGSHLDGPISRIVKRGLALLWTDRVFVDQFHVVGFVFKFYKHHAAVRPGPEPDPRSEESQRFPLFKKKLIFSKLTTANGIIVLVPNTSIALHRLISEWTALRNNY